MDPPEGGGTPKLPSSKPKRPRRDDLAILGLYRKWNPVHPTIGTFSGLGLGLGCGVGWGLGIGMPALGYVGAGCGVGFTVGFTFAGIGVGLPLIWQQTTSITDTEETSLVSAERSGHAIKVKDVLLQLQGASRKVWQSTADSIKGVVAGALPPFRRP